MTAIGTMHRRQATVTLSRWLTSAEVADLLRVSPATIKTEWKKHAGLVRAARRFGRALRFDALAIDAMQKKAGVL